MTDGHGRTVDFRNTIIIMTSNVGSRFLQEAGIREGFEDANIQQSIPVQIHAGSIADLTQIGNPVSVTVLDRTALEEKPRA